MGDTQYDEFIYGGWHITQVHDDYTSQLKTIDYHLYGSYPIIPAFFDVVSFVKETAEETGTHRVAFFKTPQGEFMYDTDDDVEGWEADSAWTLSKRTGERTQKTWKLFKKTFGVKR